MTLLKQAGVDLSEPSTVKAVVDQLGELVDKLEKLI
jgi:oligoendopeptidase F